MDVSQVEGQVGAVLGILIRVVEKIGLLVTRKSLFKPSRLPVNSFRNLENVSQGLVKVWVLSLFSDGCFDACACLIQRFFPFQISEAEACCVKEYGVFGVFLQLRPVAVQDGIDLFHKGGAFDIPPMGWYQIRVFANKIMVDFPGRRNFP